jgi:hypothetical protein
VREGEDGIREVEGIVRREWYMMFRLYYSVFVILMVEHDWVFHVQPTQKIRK